MGAVRKVMLTWSGEGTSFRGEGAAGVSVPIDGESKLGPSPMETLLLSLAACVGSDVVTIVGKMRVPLTGLDVSVEGERAEDDPRRYTRIHLHCMADGVPEADAAKLERALELSAQKYCSVFHTLRPDIAFTSGIVRR